MVTSAFAVTDQRAAVTARIADSQQLAPADLAESPHHLIGSLDEIAAALEERRERWDISYWVVPGSSVDDAAPLVARLAGA
jgi:hypothetical protein